jgi:branched-chain amino acid transport system ATP-binding protein
VSAALGLHDVVKTFGGVRALDGVSIDIAPGEIHAVIGPNGAGKSTLFGVLAGEHRPDRGTVTLGERDVTSVSAHARVRLGLARAFQVARIFPTFTVRQNIDAALIAADGTSAKFWRGRSARRLAQETDAQLERMRLGAVAGQVARELSQGDRKRLEIAMALTLRPSVLLLDEPTAGMSPQETDATVDLVRRIHEEEQLTVLLTEHDMKVVFDLAQTLTVLHYGAVLCSGEPSDIRGRADVVEVYLGQGGSDA